MCGDFSVVLLFLAVVCCANGQEGVPCEAPPNVRGSCISIQSCRPISSLLRGSLTNEIRSYVKGLLCGYDSSRSPLICCPNESTRTVIDNGNNGGDIASQETSDDIGPFLSWPECGNSTGSIPKVVNGVDAILGQFPWMAELGYRNQKNPQLPKWLCGGSLVTYKHVLTAAHCVKGRSDLYLVRVGELDLYSDNDGAQPVDVPIASRVIHEKYSAADHTNDIAVITLERSTKGFPGVIPICLPWKPEQRKNLVGLNLYVAGWGSVYFGGPSSSKLQVASVKAIENSNCDDKFRTQSIIDDRILCAQSPTMDSCKGDSGGPLMQGKIISGKRGIHYELAGIVSYGFRCAEPGYPGVYTKVSKFLSWIDNNIDNKFA